MIPAISCLPLCFSLIVIAVGSRIVRVSRQSFGIEGIRNAPDFLGITVLNTTTSTASSPAQNGPQAIQTGSGPVFVLVPETSVSSNGINVPTAEELTRPFVMAYYPDWISEDFPPERIDFERIDWIDFAFAIPNKDFDLIFDADLLRKLVDIAHTARKKVKLSIGGWDGSKYFSGAVSKPFNRQILLRNILAIYWQFNLDGIDIDWEYPGQRGADGNDMNPDDTSNFLKFLQLLRAALPLNAMITAAVQTSPFVGPQGTPMADLSGFAAVLDWLTIMNYDIFGWSSTPGPNAPLSNACNNSSQPNGNAVSAFNSWTDRGIPANKLVLGLPSYGYVFKSSENHLTSRSNSRHFKSQRLRATFSPDDNGQMEFRQLCDQGALVLINSSWEGSGGCKRHWDSCSTTPFLLCEETKHVVAYDDPESIALKAAFAKNANMRGVNLFQVQGDNDNWDLIDSARKGLGLLK